MSQKEVLIERARDANPAVRAAAIQELGLAGDPSLTSLFLFAMDDPEWQVRLEGLTSLANLGSSAAIPAIRPLLEDDHPAVRQLARDAIRVLQKVQALQAPLNSVSPTYGLSFTDLHWPPWMRRVEIAFATVSALFAILFTIIFLTGNFGGDIPTGQVMDAVSFLALVLGIVFIVFLAAGVLQVRPRFHDLIDLVRHQPWRRLVELAFLVDIIGTFTSDLVGQILFIIGLAAGVPLSLAFVISEIWLALASRNPVPTDPPPDPEP